MHERVCFKCQKCNVNNHSRFLVYLLAEGITLACVSKLQWTPRRYYYLTYDT